MRGLRLNWVILGVLMALVVPMAAWAQVDEAFQVWAPINVEVPLPHHLILSSEFRYNTTVEDHEVSQMVVKPLLEYQVTDKLRIGQGFGWTPFFSPRFNEHRLWQQARYDTQISKLAIMQRVRMEERFIEHADDPAFRARYMLQGSYPLNESRTWALLASDEVFLNLNSPNLAPGRRVAGGLSQNRLFLGVTHQLNPHARLRTGYLMQFIDHRITANSLYHSLVMGIDFFL